jgi:hypothetical protein
MNIPGFTAEAALKKSPDRNYIGVLLKALRDKEGIIPQAANDYHCGCSGDVCCCCHITDCICAVIGGGPI